jgi:hypothetical protein
VGEADAGQSHADCSARVSQTKEKMTISEEFPPGTLMRVKNDVAQWVSYKDYPITNERQSVTRSYKAGDLFRVIDEAYVVYIMEPNNYIPLYTRESIFTKAI